jgi:hypothetical protein
MWLVPLANIKGPNIAMDWTYIKIAVLKWPISVISPLVSTPVLLSPVYVWIPM